ncbi:hypothetical protein MCEMIE4_00561 [Sphingobium cupriresistens]
MNPPVLMRPVRPCRRLCKAMDRVAAMDDDMADHLAAEAFGPLGDRPIVRIDCQTADADKMACRYRQDMRAIVAGIDRAGQCPPLDPAPFDILLTSAMAPPSPWVAVSEGRMEDRIAGIQARITDAPLAAAIAMDVARACDHLPFDLGIAAESLGYSTLLANDEFRIWRRRQARSSAMAEQADRPQVEIERADDHVRITLARPSTPPPWRCCSPQNWRSRSAPRSTRW